MTSEKRKVYRKKWRDEHREHLREQRKKYREEHREEKNSQHRKYKAEHREHLRECKYADVNCAGVTKHLIRIMSNKILSSSHAKLQGYEIHHCFGYENPNRFIYIPKTLHTQIHRLLRDNDIPADSVHWNAIRDLVNECEEYTYIRC